MAILPGYSMCQPKLKGVRYETFVPPAFYSAFFV